MATTCYLHGKLLDSFLDIYLKSNTDLGDAVHDRTVCV
jgi:hypothetical protein